MNFATCIKSISVNSITSIIDFNKQRGNYSELITNTEHDL